MMTRAIYRHSRLGFLACCCLLSLSACSVNPVSGRPEVTLVTAEKEKEIGEEESKKVEKEMGLFEDPALTGYFEMVGQRLAKESPPQDVSYRFHVVVCPNRMRLPCRAAMCTSLVVFLSWQIPRMNWPGWSATKSAT